MIATEYSLPKRNHVAKEAVSAASQTNTRQRSEETLQTERCSKDDAAALRKNHVVGLEVAILPDRDPVREAGEAFSGALSD